MDAATFASAADAEAELAKHADDPDFDGAEVESAPVPDEILDAIAGAGMRVLYNRSQLAAMASLREKEALMQHQARMASLGSIAGGIAHEINNPLAILDGLLGRMYRAATATPSKLDVPTLVQNIEQCRSTIQRINRVIKSMRNLVRSPRWDQLMQVPLGQVVESGTGILQERIRAENIVLDVSLDDAEHEQVSCMLSELAQVLVNLLQNAIDAVISSRQAAG
jgi:C4-dicarboxylate-specific signal transduction histidine kinase